VPIYAWICDACSEGFETSCGMHDARPEVMRCKYCGEKAAHRNWQAEQSGVDNTCWEQAQWSDGLAIHPKQRAEAEEFNKRMGVPHTEYDGVGRPGFRSRKHRKVYGEAWAAFDRDGGYGDAQPGKRPAEEFLDA